MAKPATGPYQLDLERYELRRGDGVKVKLERQPMELLIFLVERKGRLVTREELIARLWGHGVAMETEPAINNAVRKIRSALRDSPEAPTHLETVVGKGYRFIGDIEVVRAAVPSGPQPPSRAIRLPEAARIPLVAIAALLATGLALWLGWGKFTRGPIRSIAVLPFENLSGDPGQSYFADGLTDELTTQLARVGSLRVISRTSTMRYTDRRKSMSQIAKELSVDAVIEGSVVRSGNRVRVTAQLIDGRSDTHLWAQSYERDIGEILELQDSMALDIASQSTATLTADVRRALVSRHRVKPEAYEAYLRGRMEIEKQTGASLRKSAEYFRRAIDLDPFYAPAHSGLADSYTLMANYSLITPLEAFPQAERAARKALELDPQLPEPHASLAVIKHHFYWDWSGAEAEYRQAIRLVPSFSMAHLRYAWYLSDCGRHEEALDEIRKARDSDPLSLIVRNNVGRVFYLWRRYDDAAHEMQDVIAIDGNRAWAHIFLGGIYEQKRMYPDAIAELRRGGELLGIGSGVGLASAYASSGQTSDARRLLVELETTPDHGVVDWYFIAAVYGALGDQDRAFARLEKAYENRDFMLTQMKVDPRMDPLRSDPRFAGILVRIGMPGQR